MADNSDKEKEITMTEYESERERLANIVDIIMRIRKAKAEGKEVYTADEIIDFLLEFASDIKQHK